MGIVFAPLVRRDSGVQILALTRPPSLAANYTPGGGPPTPGVITPSSTPASFAGSGRRALPFCFLVSAFEPDRLGSLVNG